MLCNCSRFVILLREPCRHLQGDIMYKCLESRTDRVTLSHFHYFQRISTHLFRSFQPLQVFEQEHVCRSHSPRIARAQQVTLRPFYFFPGQQLKASHRQYSAKSSPFPLLSEISASGLTAPRIVIRTVYLITHRPARPANLSLQSPVQTHVASRNNSWDSGQLVCHEHCSGFVTLTVTRRRDIQKYVRSCCACDEWPACSGPFTPVH